MAQAGPQSNQPGHHSHTATGTFAAYYRLTKPGIIYGNVMTTAAGFLFAQSLQSGPAFDWLRFAAVLTGTALVIAAGCVLNNIMDRHIDAKMERTKDRALVNGSIKIGHAAWFAGLLGAIGVILLARYTNMLTVYIGIAGLYSYVIAYGYSKRQGPIGTIIGSFSGATPILAGYTALTNRLDLAGALVFLAMVIWQMPHFYAIAIYRLSDYRKAGIPVLPAVKGNAHARLHILSYILAYGLTAALLSVLGYTGWCFGIAMVALSAYWFWQGYRTPEADGRWARGMFGSSLTVLLVFSVLLATNAILP